jgi:spermidine synthase
VRNIYNGATLHGSQILNSDRSLEPIAYYHRTQCIADAFALVPSPRRIGIIGLGAGALAAYSRPGDSLDFFEIDPENENLARRWFTWLERSQVSPKVYVGDGRLLLSRSAATYDYLQVDAFSGDGIPVHLLGVEALRVYRERLSEKGILLLHISNRYYDLRPVLKATAQVDGWFGVFDGPRKVVDPLSKSAMCVVLARDPSQLQGFLDLGWRSFGPADGLPDVEPWTDDYVNMVEALMRGRPAVIANPHETQ